MTTSNKNQLQSFLFSTAGVVAMLVILVAVYIITGVVKLRMDLTHERLYTLSKGTKAIIEKAHKVGALILVMARMSAHPVPRNVVLLDGRT